MSEKTQQPTAKKLRDAQKKGQIPKSKLFTSAAVTLGGLSATLAFADDMTRRLMGWTRRPSRHWSRQSACSRPAPRRA